MIRKILSTILFSVFICANLWATHNRAGEITYEQISALTYKVTITTYTKTSSVDADRSELEINWGDGTVDTIPRVNGTGTPLPNDVKFNIYEGTHTYPGPSSYVLSMRDPNRNAGVRNINMGNSVDVPFYIETKLIVLDPQFFGFNNTPQLLNPPIDNGVVGQPFIHNPNAYDIDGDSLSYELIVPQQSVGVAVPQYQDPDQIIPGPNNQISLDPITGDFVWDAPQIFGLYNIAIRINEYRQGKLIGCVVRDMQIFIEDLDNIAPVIEPIEDICVIACDTVSFTVFASDEDDLQIVTLTATGGPLETSFPNPATFNQTVFGNPVEGEFNWITECDNIRKESYDVVFKAEDNFVVNGDSSIPFPLVDLENVKIKVIGPAPEDFTVALLPNGDAQLDWKNPYKCFTSEKFIGFSIWRREGSFTYVQDTCSPMIQGYTKIEEDYFDYTYVDSDIEKGKLYCYRIVPNFAEKNPSGFVYNKVEGLATEEMCIELPKDVPIITNVSVDETDISTGEMFVQWSKPKADALDTLLNLPPYTYNLYRVDGFATTGMTLIQTFTANTFATSNDTNFVDTGLNTQDQSYTYQVEFISNGDTLGSTATASSVYLTVTSGDQELSLSWQEQVPWGNYLYSVHRFNNNTAVWDSIGETNVPQYLDKNLQNDSTYCYYIKSIGSYYTDGIIDPIINLSQEACGVPEDRMPPCPPVLRVYNECDKLDIAIGPFQNLLGWDTPREVCGDDDVAYYEIHYAPMEGEPFVFIENVNNPFDTSYFHQLSNTLAGCYFIKAVDLKGNVSEASNIVCVDNCPNYELPNVFTPNGDGANELFTPFKPYAFIDRIDIKIYNRWGGLVFQSTDPEINWDGNHIDSGNPVAEGTYYYVCEVFETRVTGVTKRAEPLSGYIHVIRGK